MSEALKIIRAQQRAWARQRNIPFDSDDYTFILEDNLFTPLSPATISEFASGGGDELGNTDHRGKMQALHSSSALVCNVFEYWRSRDVSAIASACGALKGMSKLRFEQTHPTGLRGTPPHLDIEFYSEAQSPLAIESKFTEPYQSTSKSGFRESYFSQPGLWDGLPICSILARKIYEGKKTFVRFDAAQILKHILGLTKAFPEGFTFLYLWYEIPSLEAREHGHEIESFKENTAGEVDFRDMTYQQLFLSIKGMPEAEETYVSYLKGRYFS